MIKITDNSDELTFHQLTSRSAILSVPLFQRPYVWTKKQLDRMTSEIESVADKRDGSRFLGAIIAVTRPANPSQPTPLEIVDGQQRLTTLFLFLLAAAQVAARNGKSEFARGLIGTNLIVEWSQETYSNVKLQPSIVDRPQFKAIFDMVAKTGDLSDWLPFKARVPNGAGLADGPIVRQFKNIQKYLRQKESSGGFALVEQLVDAARNGLTFVFILLKDPGSATTVFEGLNDPGVPISVGDLVKNEIFARIGHDEKVAQVLHDGEWTEFRAKFGAKFDDYFFPYCLILKSSANRTEMFSELRQIWASLSAHQIIERLEEYATSYLALNGDIGAASRYPNSVSEMLARLSMLKQPAATFPFEMRLLRSLEEKSISGKETIACLEVIESFLVRRAISGIEPTGLLGLFRSMWSAMDGRPSAEKIAAVILKRLTVEWPSDHRLQEAIANRPLYGSAIAKYVVYEYDRSLGIDQPKAGDVTLEHIMPESYSGSWAGIIDKATHAKVKDLWANLVPLSVAMNQSISNGAFEKKRVVLMKESMFASARQLAERHEQWTEKEIAERSRLLGGWAVSRWPRPAG